MPVSNASTTICAASQSSMTDAAKNGDTSKARAQSKRARQCGVSPLCLEGWEFGMDFLLLDQPCFLGSRSLFPPHKGLASCDGTSPPHKAPGTMLSSYNQMHFCRLHLEPSQRCTSPTSGWYGDAFLATCNMSSTTRGCWLQRLQVLWSMRSGVSNCLMP